MSMTRQHFEEIASELKRVSASHETCVAMARACMRFNPNFAVYLFFCACGIDADEAKDLKDDFLVKWAV